MQPTALPPGTEVLDTPRIVREPGVCGGKPRIDGHRVKVAHVAICHERMGMSADEIATAHPSISLAQIHAALAYYFDHKAEIDADIEEGERFAAAMKAETPPSRLRKLLEARTVAHGSDDSLSSG